METQTFGYSVTKQRLISSTETLTASVELLHVWLSQVSVWFFSSGVQLAMKALWITRFGVFVKEKALVT